MKLFYDIRYRCFNRQCKKPLCFFLLSDIHFAPKVTSETLDNLIAAAKSKQPDYIIVPGDLIDYLDIIDDKSELKRFLSWFERLGRIAPTLIGLGNHDFYRINHDRKPKFLGRYPWLIEYPNHLIEQLSALENIHLLNNSTYEDDRIYVFGFTQTPEYFSLDSSDEPTIRSNIEDCGIMLHDLREIPADKLHNLPPNKVKLALAHSPFCLFNQEVETFFSGFDFTISGHTHNGAVPPIINDFWRSDRGLSAPGNAKIFPDHARAGLFGKHLICGAVTTISTSARKLSFLNTAFPINIATLELSNNIVYQRKPNIKRKYHN